MILIDAPYVSDFLKTTIREHDLPVVGTKAAAAFGFDAGPQVISEDEAVARVRAAVHPRLYTNSENAIGWIARHLAFTDLPEKIDLFKDKLRFRRLTQALYPDFFFREVRREDLDDLDATTLPAPFIIKPAVGFFSMGVYKVADAAAWPETLAAIHAEMDALRGLYPPEVMDAASFIIEQNIAGEEYAFDAWFDGAGRPHIAGVYKHLFSSDADTSDRVYVTSRAIVEANLARFTDFLAEIGRLTGVQDFPLHTEVRITPDGDLLPIEINPMRFGGWCTTADMTAYAYGLNPYVAYLHEQPPDWPALLADKGDEVYAMIVLDNSAGVPGADIAAFDYQRVAAGFDHVLDVRAIDWRAWPVFGFLFVRSSGEDAPELRRILASDLREFVTPLS